MRILVALNYPAWPARPGSGRERNAHCSEIAAALRSLADRFQHCGVAAGDVVTERPSGLTMSARIELPDAPADAA